MHIRLFAHCFLLSLFLVGCGWQLKGNLQPEADLESLHFDSQLPTYQRGPDSIENTFLRRLEQIGVPLNDTPSESELGVTILSEETQETVLSLTSDLFEQQIRLRKTVAYRISQGEEVLIARNEISAFRNISEDQSSAAAKNRERDLLISEINLDLTNQIILHLQRVKAAVNADQS